MPPQFISRGIARCAPCEEAWRDIEPTFDHTSTDMTCDGPVTNSQQQRCDGCGDCRAMDNDTLCEACWLLTK